MLEAAENAAGMSAKETEDAITRYLNTESLLRSTEEEAKKKIRDLNDDLKAKTNPLKRQLEDSGGRDRSIRQGGANCRSTGQEGSPDLN